MIPVYAYDRRAGKKRYVGCFATLEEADAAERQAKEEFGTRWSADADWRASLSPEELAACEAALADGEQLVYFMQGVDGGPIKIGIASDPEDRLRQLQTQGPLRLAIRHVVPGGAVLEAELHLRFARWRLWGEWFTPIAELRALCGVLPAAKDWVSLDSVQRLERERDHWQERALTAEEVLGDVNAALEGAAKSQRLRAVS